jgi:hypothetical protein
MTVRYERGTQVRKALLISYRLDQLGAGHVECIPIPDEKELVMTVTNQFSAHVGLDWADKKHDVCVQFKNGERVFHVIKHTAEALEVWLTELHQKVKGRIAIAVELKKDPVVYALRKYPFITLFPVHACPWLVTGKPSRPAALKMTRRMPNWH